VAEDIYVDFVGEVIVADGLKEIGPVVIKLEVVNVRVIAE
jgi:hypothetical protein